VWPSVFRKPKNTLLMSVSSNFCPRRFNNFAFYPSDDASGKLLTVWNSSLFSGIVIDMNRFALTVKLTSLQSGQEWFLTNIYEPCSAGGRAGLIMMSQPMIYGL
jgi:hypothetical protein